MNPITDTPILRAVTPELQASRERFIGALLVDTGKLSVEDAERVLRFQKEKGLRFGEAAIKLGLLTEADIQQVLSRQFDYPVVLPGESNLGNELVAAYDPNSKQVEAFRALRSQLMLRWFAPEPERRALAVVSAERGAGRSYLAANLAIVFSQLGEKTLLVDADLRHPRQHQLFGLENTHGLSTVLSERVEGAIQRVPALVDLSVVTAGPVPPNPQELLSRLVFARELEKAGAQFDIVIIDTPPIGQYADAQTVAVRAGGALVVARRNRTHVSKLRELGDTLKQASAEVVGVVLNEH
jgi:receptor protein-tyrosine kinase